LPLAFNIDRALDRSPWFNASNLSLKGVDCIQRVPRNVQRSLCALAMIDLRVSARRETEDFGQELPASRDGILSRIVWPVVVDADHDAFVESSQPMPSMPNHIDPR
jgi:hypothetical protein